MRTPGARGATGRKKYLKFEGHYHGWDDSVLAGYKVSPDQFAMLPQAEPFEVARFPQIERGVRPIAGQKIIRQREFFAVDDDVTGTK